MARGEPVPQTAVDRGICCSEANDIETESAQSLAQLFPALVVHGAAGTPGWNPRASRWYTRRTWFTISATGRASVRIVVPARA